MAFSLLLLSSLLASIIRMKSETDFFSLPLSFAPFLSLSLSICTALLPQNGLLMCQPSNEYGGIIYEADSD